MPISSAGRRPSRKASLARRSAASFVALDAAARVEGQERRERQRLDRHELDRPGDSVVPQLEGGRRQVRDRLAAARDEDVDVHGLDARAERERGRCLLRETRSAHRQPEQQGGRRSRSHGAVASLRSASKTGSARRAGANR